MRLGASTHPIAERRYFKPFCKNIIAEGHPETVVSILARCGRPLTPQPTTYTGKHNKEAVA